MHNVKISGVRTLEVGTQCKGTVRWEADVPLTEAGRYNNSDAVILTGDEFKALTGESTSQESEYAPDVFSLDSLAEELIQLGDKLRRQLRHERAEAGKLAQPEDIDIFKFEEKAQ